MTTGLTRKISNQVHFYYHYLFRQKQSKLSVVHRNIVLFGIPTHRNIGDQAIVYAEHEFLKDKFPSKNIVEIAEEETIPTLKSIKGQLRPGDVVCFNGGGNLGTMYPYQENIREAVVKHLPHTQIISFPQSIFFENGKDKEKKILEEVYHKHASFHLVLRESFSYETAQKFLPSDRLSLTPDIVLYLLKTIFGEVNLSTQRKNIICLLRNDREKKVDQTFIREMKQLLHEKKKKITYSDTMSNRELINTLVLRKQVVTSKVQEIAQNDVVITDRLHGMILSLLARRPCIVLQNGNPKIKSTVQTWLTDCPLVFYLEKANITSLKDTLQQVEHLDVTAANKWFDNLNLEKLYQPLIDIINTNSGNETNDD